MSELSRHQELICRCLERETDEFSTLFRQVGFHRVGFRQQRFERRLERQQISVMVTYRQDKWIRRLSFLLGEGDRINPQWVSDKLKTRQGFGQEIAYEFPAEQIPNQQDVGQVPIEKEILDIHARCQHEFASDQIWADLEELEEEYRYVNSHQVHGSFRQKLWKGRVGVAFRKPDPQAETFKFSFSDPEMIVLGIKQRLSQLKNQGHMIALPKGRYQAVLSPWVTSTLVRVITGFLHMGATWPTHLSENLGEDIEIWDRFDVPTTGWRGAFDHEGTLCRSKCLIEKGMPKDEMGDVALALKHKRVPTGNGFRRGSFGEEPLMATANTRPIYLDMPTGKEQLDAVIPSQEIYVYFDRLIVPHDRFQSLGKSSGLVTMIGRVLKGDRGLGEFVLDVPRDRELLEGLDPNARGVFSLSEAKILAEYETTPLGKIPYLYLPEVCI